jgi:hypothetical protein
MTELSENFRNYLFDSHRRRNIAISFYAVLIGLVFIQFGLERIVDIMTGLHEIKTGQVEADCAGCYIFGVISILISMLGVFIIGITVHRLRTNWPKPRQIGRVELIRRTIGFWMFFPTYLYLWISDYPGEITWIFVLAGLLLSTPIDLSLIKSTFPTVSIGTDRADQNPYNAIALDVVKFVLYLLLLFIFIYILALFFPIF